MAGQSFAIIKGKEGSFLRLVLFGLLCTEGFQPQADQIDRGLGTAGIALGKAMVVDLRQQIFIYCDAEAGFFGWHSITSASILHQCITDVKIQKCEFDRFIGDAL